MSLGRHNFPHPSGRGVIISQDATEDTPALPLPAVAGAGAAAAVAAGVAAAIARPVAADRGAVTVDAVRAGATRPPGMDGFISRVYLIYRADGKSQVGQCLGFCSADS